MATTEEAGESRRKGVLDHVKDTVRTSVPGASTTIAILEEMRERMDREDKEAETESDSSGGPQGDAPAGGADREEASSPARAGGGSPASGNNRALAARERAVAQGTRRNELVEQQLARLAERLAQQEVALREKETSLDERTRTLDARESSLNERAGKVSQREVELVERSSRLDKREQAQGEQASQEAAPPRSHTVGSGDTLRRIAQRYYGDEMQWKRVYEANRDKISNPDIIHIGQVFLIP